MSNAREVTILPVRPGSLNQQDRAALRRAGVVVVEHENPGELRLIRPGAEVDAGTMLVCAMKALAAKGDTEYVRDARNMFVRLLADTMYLPKK